MKKININYLKKSYQDRLVLSIKEASFSPALIGVMGTNGAGKSTFLLALAGLIHSENKVTGDGKPLNLNGTVWRSSLGFLPQSPNLYEEMSVYRFCDYMLTLSNWTGDKEAQIIKYLARLNILEQKNRPIYSLSGGMRQRLAIIQALIHEPQVIMFDEPCNHLDIEERRRFHYLLLEFASKGRFIFYVGHSANELFDFCSSLLVLHKGHIVFHGTKDALKEKICHHLVEEIWQKPMDIQKLVSTPNIVRLTDEGDTYKIRLAVPGAPDEYRLSHDELYQLFLKSVS